MIYLHVLNRRGKGVTSPMRSAGLDQYLQLAELGSSASLEL